MKDDRSNRRVELEDGRKLGFAEYGDPAGGVVFHFHGSAGSRLEHPVDESILKDLKIRFISTDRPGHGLSDPQPDRTLLDGPKDINFLADRLGIDTFYVLGWSAGGPHALACAFQLAKRVRAGAVVSGLAPADRPSPYRGYSLASRMLLFVFRRMPRLVYAVRRGMYSLTQADPEDLGKKLISSCPPADRELLENLVNLKLMIADIQEGYRQGWQGPAQDDIIINRSWGFRLEDIPARIDIWQGEVDRNVPLNQGQYLSETIPNCRLTVLPGQAHLYLLSYWRDVLSSLVS